MGKNLILGGWGNTDMKSYDEIIYIYIIYISTYRTRVNRVIKAGDQWVASWLLWFVMTSIGELQGVFISYNHTLVRT